MKAKWTNESKPIIENAEPSMRYGPKFQHMRKYRINARISLTDKDEMTKNQMMKLIEKMESIVKAFRATEKYL